MLDILSNYELLVIPWCYSVVRLGVMLFTVTKGKIKEKYPELLNFEAFRMATDSVLKYVFLMYDYKSPYRQHKEHRRKILVLRWLGVDDEKKASVWLDQNSLSIESVRTQLMELQYDDEVELYLGYLHQIRTWTEILKKEKQTPDDYNIIKDFTKNVVEFIDNLRSLEREIGERVKDIDKRTGKVKSSLERFIDNLDTDNF